MTDTTRLESAGITLSRMGDEQKAVLEGLTDEEVKVLTSIKQRLDATTADVEGHAARNTDDGYVFW